MALVAVYKDSGPVRLVRLGEASKDVSPDVEEDAAQLLNAFVMADGTRLVLKHLARRLGWSAMRTTRARSVLRQRKYLIEEYAGPGNTVWFLFPYNAKEGDRKAFLYSFMNEWINRTGGIR